MNSIVEQLRAEGRQDGIRQGIQQGIEQGIEQGMQQGMQQGEQKGRQQLLIRLLEKRFGRLDAGTVERLQAASTAELDQWGERILDAASLEEVFRIH